MPVAVVALPALVILLVLEEVVVAVPARSQRRRALPLAMSNRPAANFETRASRRNTYTGGPLEWLDDGVAPCLCGEADDKVPVTFDGASGASMQPPILWECADCHKKYALVSVMAYLDDNNDFAIMQDVNYSHTMLAVENEKPSSDFVNRFSQTHTRLVCAYCCSILHDRTYVRDAVTNKCTSYFDKIRRRAFGSQQIAQLRSF